MTHPVSAAALRQFNLRRRAAQAQLGKRAWSREEADARLFPWLALALRCWADPAQLHADLPAMLAELTEGFAMPEARARATLADDYCSREEALATLANARDQAISAVLRDRFDTAPAAARAATNAEDLAHMAMHLGAAGYRDPAEQREAA